MQFDLKAMYGYLISHTFPGCLLLFELLMLYKWFANPKIFHVLHQYFPSETKSVIVLLIIGYVFSTLLGVIVDGIQHFCFEDFLRKPSPEVKFPALKDEFTVNIYKHFLEDDLWFYYEAYANVAIVMLFPGIILFAHGLSNILHLHAWGYCLSILFYIILLSILFYEAYRTRRSFMADEEEFVKVHKVEAK
jgi:hypothetical protein